MRVAQVVCTSQYWFEGCCSKAARAGCSALNSSPLMSLSPTNVVKAAKGRRSQALYAQNQIFVAAAASLTPTGAISRL